MSDGCKAVRGSKSRAGAARERGDRGEAGERTARGERDVSGSIVMAGQEEDVASGDGQVRAGVKVDRGFDLDGDPDPGLKPAWTTEGNGGQRFDSDNLYGTRTDSESAADEVKSKQDTTECWTKPDPGL